MDYDLEQLAAAALERTNLDAPVDPDILAHRLGIEVNDGGPGCEGLLLGDLVLIDDSLRPERRAFAIAHELGHWLLRWAGAADTEHRANYVASALLLPRDAFERDLRRYGWDLLRLRARHRLASHEALARRIVALRNARAFIFDKPLAGQARPRWYSVPYGQRPHPAEREAAAVAASTGAPAEPYGGVTAWPVLEHDWHRVVTVADPEALQAAPVR